MSVSQEYFADELRLARKDAGLSQEQLATKMYVSTSLVAMVETCQRLPLREFASAADDALGTNGRFDRMSKQLLRGSASPSWFQPWVNFEREATEIISFEPLTHLAETSVTVQILPSEAETYRHLLGGFTIATVDGSKIGYVDTAIRGFVVESPDLLALAEKRWDIIRAEALPRRQSRDLIMRRAEEWTSS